MIIEQFSNISGGSNKCEKIKDSRLVLQVSKDCWGRKDI